MAWMGLKNGTDTFFGFRFRSVSVLSVLDHSILIVPKNWFLIEKFYLTFYGVSNFPIGQNADKVAIESSKL